MAPRGTLSQKQISGHSWPSPSWIVAPGSLVYRFHVLKMKHFKLVKYLIFSFNVSTSSWNAVFPHHSQLLIIREQVYASKLNSFLYPSTIEDVSSSFKIYMLSKIFLLIFFFFSESESSFLKIVKSDSALFSYLF